MTKARQLDETEPFTVEPVDHGGAVVRFAEFVDHPRSQQQDEQLLGAVRRWGAVACDLRDTVEIDSDWLRLVARMSMEAGASGKRVGIVGMRQEIRSGADVLGILDALKFFDTVEEVLG